MSDWIVKSWRLINRLGHTGWKYQKVPDRSSVEHRVVKSTFICNGLCTEENELFLLVWMAVNLHSNAEFWGCICVSAQELTSLLNTFIFSAKLQPIQVNTLPSKAYLSSQHVSPESGLKDVFPPAAEGTSVCAPVLYDWGCMEVGIAVLLEWNRRVVPWSPTIDTSKTCPQAKTTSLSLKGRYFNINFHLHPYCCYREDPAVQVWFFSSSVSNFRK